LGLEFVGFGVERGDGKGVVGEGADGGEAEEDVLAWGPGLTWIEEDVLVWWVLRWRWRRVRLEGALLDLI
jgi:hypothetical protein